MLFRSHICISAGVPVQAYERQAHGGGSEAALAHFKELSSKIANVYSGNLVRCARWMVKWCLNTTTAQTDFGTTRCHDYCS